MTAALVAPAAAAADTYTVTSPDDGRGTCTATTCPTLRTALESVAPGDTIRLPDHGRPYAQNGQLGPFEITRSVTLVGDGANRTVIGGNAGTQVFWVQTPEAGPTPTVVMSHLQVAGGNPGFNAGGNILNIGADLTLDHVRVTGGRAYQGGGIANIEGSLVIRHSLIDHNTAEYSESGAHGGGIYNFTPFDGSLLVEDSTIAFNTAQIGGGVYVESAIAGRGLGQAQRRLAPPVLRRVTIARNTATGDPFEPNPERGAGIDVSVSGVSVSGSIVANNVYEPEEGQPRPANCRPNVPPADAGGNLSDTAECFESAPADPQLSADLDGRFGETPVLPIPPSSPAVNRAGACTGTDQRDLPRPQGAACDAGAFEVSVPAIVSGPPEATTDTTVRFEFGHELPGVAFECRLDGPAGPGPWEPCTSPRAYAGLAGGPYTFWVRVAGGEPVARSFLIVAQQPPPPPPPPPPPEPTPNPVFGRAVSIKPTQGRVRVRLPGTKRFVNLDSLDTIPFGATIDVRRGRVRLYAARDRSGRRLDAASFYSGVFRVVQRGRFVELQLRGPKPTCRSGRASAQTSQKRKKKARTRRLWGSGKGRFRTRGRYSAATVRGTKWLVVDRCRTTTTRVVRGVVTVRDFRLRKTIRLRAGQRYVARRR